jgi:phosphate transport system permease protein
MNQAAPDNALRIDQLGRARSRQVRALRESIVMGLLGFCGLFTLAITVGIIFVLFKESYHFFSAPHPDAQGEIVSVSFWDFITGGTWNPLLGAEKHFGIWALILSTFKIVLVAMSFALPLGLLIAIWLSEYAKPKVRAVIKPVLEVLAGIPTVVFGFFALTVITPMLKLDFENIHPALGFLNFGEEGGFNPLDLGTYNALSAGLAVGIMCLPIVTSLSEDALRSVPRELREGAYGLGSNRFETSIKVVVPAALSGIIAAFLLAIARAVGETMIVALAAGSTPVQMRDVDGNIDWSQIFALNTDVQPMTGYMVQIFTGDAPHGTVEYYSSYAVAATLFVLTLGITVVGNLVQRRFREHYT